MAPKNKWKKQGKVQKSGPGGRDIKRPLGSPVVVTRIATPATPIPALVVSASQPELKVAGASNGEAKTVKKWCFENTPVYYAPDEPWPSTSLNKGAIVELTGQELRVSAADVKTLWSEIVYKIQDLQAGRQWVTGWVNDAYLDDYSEKFQDSGVLIQNPTPNPPDAQQYMLLEGKVRYNLCGEFCVAFIVNGDIDSVLAAWKKNSPGSYNVILAGGRDSTTSENDLKNMLGAVLGEYGYGSDDDQLISLRNKITYPVTPAGLLEDLRKMLTTHYLISGVTINGAGELIGKENPRIKHWVVLDKITHNGNRVEIYNPFPNKREEYSFTEFYKSCGTNSGVWVKRKNARPSRPARDLPKLEVAIANPNPLYRAAQYVDVDGKKKTNLCGEFCVALIVKESINAVLERWKEVQPVLYADIVGNNKGTGTFALHTILKSYGYNTEGDVREFSAGLIDPYLKKSLFSPGRIAKMLKTHFLIAGVNIDGLTGKLKPGEDVRHWVVVVKLILSGKNRGWVQLYNPFPNCREEYSYREFTNAAGYWSGLWVKREIVPVFVPQVVEGSNQEDQPRKDGRIGQWTEAQLLDAIKRKLKNKKPINKTAAELAELSGWKRQEILSRLKKITRAGSGGVWTETRLRQEMQRRLRSGKPVSKIYAELTKVSGWKKQDVVSTLKKLLVAEKWSEAQVLAAIREKLKRAKSINKVAADLAERSGWKKREILSSLKKRKEAEKWTEAQLRSEIEKRLRLGKSATKISAELIQVSGWKKREIITALKKVVEAQKWTEAEVLAAISEKLKTIKSENKVAAELAAKSGWKKHEVISRLRKLLVAAKWTEAQLREEIRKQLEIGKPANKIATELVEMSGWRKWQISKIIKMTRDLEKVTKTKARLKMAEELVRVVDPSTIVHASKTRAEFVEWQNSLLARPNSKLYKVRKWGDPIMVRYGFDVDQAGTTNFQAVGLYNDGNRQFGAISNYIRLPHEDVLRLKAMQIEDEYEAKGKIKDWRKQKMKWLCKARGTIYFYYHHASQGDWETLSYIEWGTLALGGNLVQVEGTEVVHAKMRNGMDGDVEVARLKGFGPFDWDRPLDDLLAEGLVHRCFCAYKSNHFGDTPKGIVYSPFYSPQYWEFPGGLRPTALYIPVEWLEPKG